MHQFFGMLHIHAHLLKSYLTHPIKMKCIAKRHCCAFKIKKAFLRLLKSKARDHYNDYLKSIITQILKGVITPFQKALEDFSK